MENGVAVIEKPQAAIAVKYNPEQVALIKSQVARDCTDGELQLFLYQCQRTGLDALNRQIYAIKRGGKMAIQTSIDGFRLIAERSGKYEGQTPVMWCGEDAQWVEVWLKNERPAAAKVGVYRAGFRDAVYAVAKWNEYADDNGPMWRKMGAHMLAKCAESLALRKAFPQELSGLYTSDEMQQADNPAPEVQTAQVVETSPLPLRPMAPKDVPEEVMKGWRKWRAWFNPRALKCETSAELDKVCEDFEAQHKAVPRIWDAWTFHDDFETFGSLSAAHRARVERNDWEKSPAGLAEWRADLAKVKDEAGFRRFEDQYTKREYLHTQENLDAIHEKGMELGIPEYSDLDDAGTDSQG
jgi:phage recombination protein Bet